MKVFDAGAGCSAESGELVQVEKICSVLHSADVAKSGVAALVKLFKVDSACSVLQVFNVAEGPAGQSAGAKSATANQLVKVIEGEFTGLRLKLGKIVSPLTKLFVKPAFLPQIRNQSSQSAHLFV